MNSLLSVTKKVWLQQQNNLVLLTHFFSPDCKDQFYKMLFHQNKALVGSYWCHQFQITCVSWQTWKTFFCLLLYNLHDKNIFKKWVVAQYLTTEEQKALLSLPLSQCRFAIFNCITLRGRPRVHLHKCVSVRAEVGVCLRVCVFTRPWAFLWIWGSMH